MMTKAQEFEIKLERVNEYMKANKAKCLLLSKAPHLAWLTCGGQMHVNTSTETAVATAVIRNGKVTLLTNNIEALRMVREEIRGLPIPVESVMWYEDKTAWILKTAGRGKVLSDIPMPDTQPLPGDFIGRTFQLTEGEINRYVQLGKDVGGALERAARAVKPGMSEGQIGGLLASECYLTATQPVVVLVAVDDRISSFRHPIPTIRKMRKTAMLVVCGRRGGLIISATRIVSFGKLSKELRKRHDAVVEIDGYFNLASRPGEKITDIFKGAQEIYKQTGFADEWTLHHQGGATGYLTRDYLGTPTSNQVVCENQAFAWNPSITGTKSEDTILVGSRKNKVLSLGKDWPSIEVKVNRAKILRPDILVR